MVNNWIKAYKSYNWTVDLSKFQDAKKYQKAFNSVITPQKLIEFETSFRMQINSPDNFSFVRAGEVCFWKNYGAFQTRNTITGKLLNYLSIRRQWDQFSLAIQSLSKDPKYEKFLELATACNQPYGFATPITFLAFYQPTDFPMVDRHIADWWNNNSDTFGYKKQLKFNYPAGTITKSENNWYAYIYWTIFCNDIAKIMSTKYQILWRPRDVEMAVWQAQKNKIALDIP
jgi:hypothetical protein